MTSSRIETRDLLVLCNWEARNIGGSLYMVNHMGMGKFKWKDCQKGKENSICGPKNGENWRLNTYLAKLFG